ncbi:VWA domain-containing protein [bacterium]|nr:VWA domain-containing protein [bacterium]
MFIELRRYFEKLMGIEPVAAGEDTQWHVRYALGWPDWVFFLFVVFAVLLVVGIYLRESRSASRRYRFTLGIIRLFVVGLVVMMIGTLELVIDRTGLPYLVFLVDDSESMSIHDQAMKESSAPAEKSRLDQVKDWLSADNGAPLRELTKQHKIQLFAQSTDPRLIGTYIDAIEVDKFLGDLKEIKAEGRESKIGSNLRSVLNSLRGTPPSAVVIVTDGVNTQGESITQSAQYAARKNIPLFTVGVGDPGEVKDWEIRDLLVDETVFVGDLVTFQVKVAGRGVAGDKTTIRLGKKGSGEVIDEKPVTIPPGAESVNVELRFRPSEPGSDVYEITIPVDSREIAKDNNHVERRIEAIKEKIRVLYVEAYPRYEFRFLKALLEREETIELSVLLSDADPEYLAEDRTAVGYFPTTRDELFKFDVVIVGDVAPTLLSAAQIENLRDFVRVKGGGLLFIAGPEYNPRAYRDTPLQELLPVELGASLSANPSNGTNDAFRPQLTLEGKVSPIFRFANDESESLSILDQLPGAYWFTEIEKSKPAATVLAVHPSSTADGKPVPIIATQFFGAGRTFFQGFTGTWRWRNRVEDLYFARYWIQAVRLLSRSKLLGKNRAVEMVVDRRRYRRGDPAQIIVRLLDESLIGQGDSKVAVTIDRADGTSRNVELARRGNGQSVYEGVFNNTEDGTYRVRLTSPLIEGIEPLEFTVVPPPGELDRVQMNEPELKIAADVTGGKYHRINDARSLLSHLPAGRKVALHTDPPVELWNKWPVLILVVTLLGIEWILRKRRSMM